MSEARTDKSDDVTAAIQAAKEFLLKAFQGEKLESLGLEEVRRVKEYRPGDYNLIYVYLSLFSEIVLLPNVISEASNLLDHLTGERRDYCMERLAQLVQGSSERSIASVSAMQQPEYMALGVVDAAMLCALESDTYLLTADRELDLAALYRSCEAQYFQELRG